jgi:hypothetical protein
MSFEDEEDDAEHRRVAHSELRAHAREVDRINGVRFLLSDRQGRQAVWDWLSHCGVLGVSFDRDAARMAFNEGRRDVGLWMLFQLESEHPGAFALMSQENQAREQRYESIAEPRSEDDRE